MEKPLYVFACAHCEEPIPQDLCFADDPKDWLCPHCRDIKTQYELDSFESTLGQGE